MEDIDLELGQGKEGQQNPQEERAAARPEEETPPDEDIATLDTSMLWFVIRPRLSCHVTLGFRRHVVTVSVIIFSYDIETERSWMRWKGDDDVVVFVTEPPNYDGPHVPVIIIMTSDSRTYVPHNLKGLLSTEQDPIIGVLQ
jgi:hypothetical protein